MLKQYGESGEIDIGQVAEDAMVSGVVGGIAYKFTSIRNAKAGKTPTAQEISANAKTRDARKKVLDEIKASGKTPSGLRRRVDSSYALKHKELLKKYAQSSIVGNSKELLANQLEYETDIYVIKGHANIKGYIKDMLKDFLPIENSDDWIMSILSNIFWLYNYCFYFKSDLQMGICSTDRKLLFYVDLFVGIYRIYSIRNCSDIIWIHMEDRI